jgi:hypothetical protein
MYSGTTLHNKSGNLMGAHQKFDKVATKFVHDVRPKNYFPSVKEVLHFEGNNGPDAIKRKSPGKDEPWHYWDPTDEDDTKLLDIARHHYEELVIALSKDNKEKAAFEAAWLAHAIVDGFTPAHHYPYEKKLLELRGEDSLETRTSIKAKTIIKGDTHRQTIAKNWQFWGAKGLFASHFLFEWGVSTMSRGLKLKGAKPTDAIIKHAKNLDLESYLKEQVKAIYGLNMYERFLGRGWTPALAKDVRLHLAPVITETIATVWILAIDEAKTR